MTNRYSWGQRYNMLPVNHLRVSLNSRIDADPFSLLKLAEALVSSLYDQEFLDIALVHVGRGSTSAEVAVERGKAELRKTLAETEKLKAETRLTNLKLVVGSVSALYAAAMTLGIDVSEAAGKFGSFVREIAIECGATMCTFSVSDLSFDVAIPLRGSDPVLEKYAVTERVHADELQIIRGGSRITSTVIIPNDAHKNTRFQAHGTIVATDSLYPVIQCEQGNFVLYGLQELLPIAEGALVILDAIVHPSKKLRPIHIEVI